MDSGYQLLQFLNRKCDREHLLFPHNSTCSAVRDCGLGFYLSEDEYGRPHCLECSPECRSCNSSTGCTECKI